MPRLLAAAIFALSLPAVSQQATPTPDQQAMFDHTKSATVIVLTGEGAGRLHSIGTGVLISKDGVLLTALHVIKGASEVQIRLANGDVYDRVQLIGSDERRDIAALKISAGDLPALSLGNSTKLSQGDPVYAVTNAGGLTWSATSGILSAVRPADEVPGAGSGYRVLQFTDPVAPGSSGGALVNHSGELVGIITAGKGAAGFAIPIESVAGLPSSGDHIRLGTGKFLELPSKAQNEPPSSAAALAGANPKQLLQNAKTIFLTSKTAFLTVDTLDRALRLQKEWEKLGLTVVQDERLADIAIQLDRPLFTYVHTFVIVDRRTSIVLGSGKVTAFDGTIASGGLAKDIVKQFVAAKLPQTAAKK